MQIKRSMNSFTDSPVPNSQKVDAFHKCLAILDCANKNVYNL